MAAMKIQTPIVKPIPIFRAVDITRPIKAPFATRVASLADDPPVNSAMSAPRNEPTKAPMTGPMMGTGTPTIAPTMPPRIAPQPARFRAALPRTRIGIIAPRRDARESRQVASAERDAFDPSIGERHAIGEDAGNEPPHRQRSPESTGDSFDRQRDSLRACAGIHGAPIAHVVDCIAVQDRDRPLSVTRPNSRTREPELFTTGH